MLGFAPFCQKPPSRRPQPQLSLCDVQGALLEALLVYICGLTPAKSLIKCFPDVCFLMSPCAFELLLCGLTTYSLLLGMQLPANMSGAEKREKMVVWEAAISSSLTHPNIVQTYTYNIKPLKDRDKQDCSSADLQDFGSAVHICK